MSLNFVGMLCKHATIIHDKDYKYKGKLRRRSHCKNCNMKITYEYFEGSRAFCMIKTEGGF